MVYLIPVSNLGTIRYSRSLSGSPSQAPHRISSHILKCSTQSRDLWGYSHQRYGNTDSHTRIRINKHRRLCRVNLGARAAVHPRQAQTQVSWGHQHHDRHPGWNIGWGWTGSKLSFPGISQSSLQPRMDFWKSESSRIRQIKKEITVDPYAALFGRRLEPLGFPNFVEGRVMSLCRSVFGLDKAPTVDKTSHITQTRGVEDHEYDPISGRMVPRKLPEKTTGCSDRSLKTPAESCTRHDEWTGYLSGVDRSETHSSENAPTYQDSESVKKVQVAPPDIPELAKKETFGTTPSEISQRQDTTRLIKSDVDIHGNDIKEQLDPGREANADVSDERSLSKSPSFLESNHKPASYTGMDSAQQQELLAREEAEDLDLLRPSDIRLLYNAKNLKRESVEPCETPKDLDAAFDSLDPGRDANSQGAREGFQQHAAVKSGNRTTNEPAALESTKQVHSRDESPSISPPPFQKDWTDALRSGEQGRGNTQITANSSLPSDTYHILAYDPSTLQMTRGETISSFHTTHEYLHPSVVLPRLNNPAKFLPYFEEMQAEGYEIVSGGGDILVFTKALNAGNRVTDCGTEKAKIELGAAVRNEPLFSDEAISRSKLAPGLSLKLDTANTTGPTSSCDTSEGANVLSKERKSKVGKVLRRMLIGGFVTAASCYALGIVGEYFRTGGQDGRGIDGFTEFESERRHRD
ncbi:uncharacterized protein BDW43DRAFT_301994 [Aspergillus alliaceus]|uniref:uncharacterized protein n=1 Tax=Petromyces alliaceus TaxID=209559 RepID=UPI0012A63502|nr:uncharacterized protein BDW43DRAFT_301994 [Aspergillus alliaceus]KAB8231107.1 hypothetical protein BDW43DRAFT_301994 [Aspergillus alliaceus]